MLYSLIDCVGCLGTHWGIFESDSIPRSDIFYYRCPVTNKIETITNPFNSRAWSPNPPTGIKNFVTLYLNEKEVKSL